MSEYEFLDSLIVFGPVPSRRLGRSLGVNNIPPKICSYSCIYCQLGRTHNFSSSRKAYYQPDDIFERIKSRTDVIIKKGEKLDYITFVPDGEPTLDANLGIEIDMAKTLGIKTAVITNSSLLGLDCVKNDLMKADLVCLKVDAVQEAVWKKIDRPSKNISLKVVLEGIKNFSEAYKGKLITDTMLCECINDDARHVSELAGFLGIVGASVNYVSAITRPPAENNVKRPSEEKLNLVFQTINGAGGRAELNIGFEGTDFSSSGKAEDGFLSIISVHPMREDAAEVFMKNAGAEDGLVNDLKRRGKIVETFYNGKKFFVRKINGPRA